MCHFQLKTGPDFGTVCLKSADFFVYLIHFGKSLWAEGNVEERENSEVTQFLVTGYVLRTDRQTDVWTERREG